mmetsp:Transcript_45474/g.60348  ORF Transcript_45474/g.60348 Transcript_45474/m.60348 type:complete len:92 (+) Transcript_45474:422-697(+)
MGVAPSQDVLDRELKCMDTKQVFKVTRDAIRRNRYKHMHSKPTVVAQKATANESEQASLESAKKQDNLTAHGTSRKNDIQSEMRIRSNEKA